MAAVTAQRPGEIAVGDGTSLVDPAARSDRPVTAEEKIKFEQDKAHAHMRGAGRPHVSRRRVLRPNQPDDSARLLMGVTRLAGATHRRRNARSLRTDRHTRPE